MLDYRPDFDPRTPGRLTAVSDLIPTERGYKVGYAQTQVTVSTLTHATNESKINALFAARWLTGTGGIILAGTNRDLYMFSSVGFESVGKGGAAGANYDTSSAGSVKFLYGQSIPNSFDMCAFGDVIIATHKTTVPQYRLSTATAAATKFADLGTTVAAPKASVCETAANFAFLGDLGSTWGSASTVVGTADMVAWCGIGDHQNWDITPLSTQGSYAQFNDTPGPITAIKRLNDGIVVYKPASMYYGRYVGAGANSPIWDFIRISDKIGCQGHKSIVDIGGSHVFAGEQDVYIFDGTKPRSISEQQGVSSLIGVIVPTSTFGGPFLGHDFKNSSVLFSCSVSSVYVWNYRLNRWGQLGSATVTTAREVFCKTNSDSFAEFTIGTTGIATATGSGLGDLYTLSASSISGAASACVNRNTTYSTLPSFTTGAIGDDELITKFLTIKPVWAVKPSGTVTLALSTKQNLGEASWTSVGSTTLDSNYRFNLLAIGSAAKNWVQGQISWSGAAEVMAVDLDPKPAGKK